MRTRHVSAARPLCSWPRCPAQSSFPAGCRKSPCSGCSLTGCRPSCHSFGPVYVPLPQTFVLGFPVLYLPDSSQAIHTKWMIKFEGGGLVTESCPTLWTPRTVALCPWDSPGENTGVGCHFLLQGIFLTQGWSPHLLRCRRCFTAEPPGKPNQVYCSSVYYRIISSLSLD